ncbi:xylulokinase [Nocardioides cynanchi]|uniref:xylulokinase n=1 Tax=Nocardioides cynanchi TaxID=2558918 RepID=UPI001246F724|nr:xylulokinase [Nocardioides cynanchi]
MALVAGIDSSTQSCKVLVVDADTGAVVRRGRAGHPDGTEVDPRHWWEALQSAVHDAGGLDDVAAVSVGGQQHGMVALDDARAVVRPALLWNDTRSAAAAADLTDELGGPQVWADEVGLVPVASFTITKLRWLAQHEPEAAARTSAVCLPHDWLTWLLAGRPDDLVTDRSDASGTGYWSASTGTYRPDLLERALGHPAATPRVAAPDEVVGHGASGGWVLAPGCGDNAGAALGLGAAPGDAVVSLGTSGVVSAVSLVPAADASGAVAGFADATGRYLPLVATLNAAQVLDASAGLLGVDHAGLSDLARSAPSGAGGLVLVPYFQGERTPNRPDATGSLLGLTLAGTTAANLARAAVEGLWCGLADALDALRDQGAEVRRVLLVGGAAASPAVREIGAEVLGLPIDVPPAEEYVALGAARQAAWVLDAAAGAPDWAGSADGWSRHEPLTAGGPAVRARYAEARDLTLTRA